MNVIDNGISEVIEIKKVITEEEMYFSVRFIDWYGREQIKQMQSIKDIDKRQWRE
jgi:ferritin